MTDVRAKSIDKSFKLGKWTFFGMVHGKYISKYGKDSTLNLKNVRKRYRELMLRSTLTTKEEHLWFYRNRVHHCLYPETWAD